MYCIQLVYKEMYIYCNMQQYMYMQHTCIYVCMYVCMYILYMYIMLMYCIQLVYIEMYLYCNMQQYS